MPYHKNYTLEERREAKRQAQARYRQRSKDKAREYANRYYKKNRVAILARRKAKRLAEKGGMTGTVVSAL